MAAMRTSLSASAGLVQLPARVAFKPVSKAHRNIVAKASAQKVGASDKAGRVGTWSLRIIPTPHNHQLLSCVNHPGQPLI